MNRIFFLIIAILFFCIAQSQSPQILKIREYRIKEEQRILNDLLNILSIPNTATDTLGLRENANVLAQIMKQGGIGNVQFLEADETAPPVVYGEVMTPGATRTIVFYAHYDGQPVDPSQWTKGLSPFIPKIFTGRIDQGATEVPRSQTPIDPCWRIYGRGSSDDKAGVLAIYNAYQAIKNTNTKLTCNIKFFFEGEEEHGSEHLVNILDKYRQLLQSDLWIICDGPIHQSGKKRSYLE